MTDQVRISKLMTERGICSRREADRYIKNGWVRVDGEIVTLLGTKASPDAKIELLPQAKRMQTERVTILLNKPLGYVSAQPEDGHEPAIVLIKPENQDPQFPGPPLQPQHLKKLAVSGRLDINSKGLLVFTQDGRVARQLIGADTKVDKEYLVRFAGKLTEQKLERLRFGLELDGKPLKRAKVELVNEDQLRIVLREGKKRQIRRMCEAVDLQVRALKRVRIGRVKLGKLEEGCWRWLGDDESF